MLSKIHRLPLATQKSNLSQSGTKLTNSHFTLIFHPNTHSHLRAATIIGKKIDPKAVVRNRLKRQLLHTLKQTIPLSTPLDILILPKPSAAKASSNQLSSSLSSLLKKIINPQTTNNN